MTSQVLPEMRETDYPALNPTIVAFDQQNGTFKYVADMVPKEGFVSEILVTDVRDEYAVAVKMLNAQRSGLLRFVLGCAEVLQPDTESGEMQIDTNSKTYDTLRKYAVEDPEDPTSTQQLHDTITRFAAHADIFKALYKPTVEVVPVKKAAPKKSTVPRQSKTPDAREITKKDDKLTKAIELAAKLQAHYSLTIGEAATLTEVIERVFKGFDQTADPVSREQASKIVESSLNSGLLHHAGSRSGKAMVTIMPTPVPENGIYVSPSKPNTQSSVQNPEGPRYGRGLMVPTPEARPNPGARLRVIRKLMGPDLEENLISLRESIPDRSIDVRTYGSYRHPALQVFSTRDFERTELVDIIDFEQVLKQVDDIAGIHRELPFTAGLVTMKKSNNGDRYIALIPDATTYPDIRNQRQMIRSIVQSAAGDTKVGYRAKSNDITIAYVPSRVSYKDAEAAKAEVSKLFLGKTYTLEPVDL